MKIEKIKTESWWKIIDRLETVLKLKKSYPERTIAALKIRAAIVQWLKEDLHLEIED